MIHIDREAIPEPDFLLSSGAEELRAEARAFFDTPPESRAQRSYNFAHGGWVLRKLKDPLLELFHRKCAYCESLLTAGAAVDVERFRPKAGAVGLDGERSADHYWWLAFDWSNLYACCATCNRTKGTRFPVRGARAAVGTAGPDLLSEAALLLDPCRDLPERHLIFSEDGRVAAVPFDALPLEERKRFGTPTRGQVTIDTLGLNRSMLIDQRQNQAVHFLGALRSGDKGKTTVKRLLRPGEPYLALKLQLQARWQRESEALERPVPKAPLTRGSYSIPDEPPPPSLPSADEELVQRAVTEQKAHEQQILATSIEVEDDARAYRSRTAYIERVELSGVTVFDDLRFPVVEPSAGSGGDAPWLMLLGENGTGKTSILRAIALCLAGKRRLEELQSERTPERFLDLFREGGSARVFLTSQREPLEVRRVGGRLEAIGEAAEATDQAKVFLRAFGPSRWFPAAGSLPPEDDPFVRVGNLFNHFVPLDPGEAALAALARDDPRKWDDVASAMKRLLELPDDGIAPLSQEGKLRFHLGGGEPTPLRALSAGYEAVVALAGELAHLLYRRWGSLWDAEGICLLDEIDAHLHPRWKMRIVDRLRHTFPRVQFIATTHEPLCLRGLRAGEILVLRREAAPADGSGGGPVVSQVRPEEDVAALRVDQLLTSRLFGLHSTLDPDLEKELERYYSLLSRHEGSLAPEERTELAALRATVGSRGILGSTRRDQLIYQLLDRFVAREASIPTEAERREEERLTLEEVEEAWARIPDLPREPA